MPSVLLTVSLTHTHTHTSQQPPSFGHGHQRFLLTSFAHAHKRSHAFSCCYHPAPDLQPWLVSRELSRTRTQSAPLPRLLAPAPISHTHSPCWWLRCTRTHHHTLPRMLCPSPRVSSQAACCMPRLRARSFLVSCRDVDTNPAQSVSQPPARSPTDRRGHSSSVRLCHLRSLIPTGSEALDVVRTRSPPAALVLSATVHLAGTLGQDDGPGRFSHAARPPIPRPGFPSSHPQSLQLQSRGSGSAHAHTRTRSRTARR